MDRAKNNGILPVVDTQSTIIFPSVRSAEFMKAQAPHYKEDKIFQEEQAGCDSNIITANGSTTLEFAKKILELLEVKSEQARLEWYRLNKSGFNI